MCRTEYVEPLDRVKDTFMETILLFSLAVKDLMNISIIYILIDIHGSNFSLSRGEERAWEGFL